MKPQDLLLKWLERRLEGAASPAANAWLREQCALVASGAPDRVLHLAYGQVIRKTGPAGRQLLAADTVEQTEAFAVHSGWDLHDWTVDQAARAALLLALPASDNADNVDRRVKAVMSLFQTADLGEHVALARALFLLPDAKALIHIAREAIRSNMGDVFRAVSQRNPYPAERFDEIAWNQMVVKCLFVDLPLRGIWGIDARVNAELARMLTGLARERWAAGRALSPEAWRCVAPFVALPDAAAVLDAAFDKGPADRRGAALALWSTRDAAARALVAAKAAELVPRLESGTLTWENYEQD
jgi:hypothetical protein